ncbi:MAG: PspA/IM30 family protein [Chloroflexi bacterium]|nr:PspA/IM30 family protein [Chloroflexota bacterium]
MASLLEKVQTLIAANLHALVDQALKTNSLAVIDQYIRQVEDNLEDLEDAAATIGGEVKTLKRKYDEFATKSAELDRNIDLMLREGKEELAVAAQSKLNSTTRLAETYKSQFERQQLEYQKLLDGKLKLEAKLTTVKQEREEMQALLDLAKSKELTAKTMQSLDNLMGAGDQDVARMAESIRARLDKASARAEMQASRLDEQMDELLERNTLDTQLAERKKRLGLA